MHLTLSWRRPWSYRNQSIDLTCKSMDWFLYDDGLRHERALNAKSTTGFCKSLLYALSTLYQVHQIIQTDVWKKNIEKTFIKYLVNRVKVSNMNSYVDSLNYLSGIEFAVCCCNTFVSFSSRSFDIFGFTNPSGNRK